MISQKKPTQTTNHKQTTTTKKSKTTQVQTHSQRRPDLGIMLLLSLRCSANAERWSGAEASESSPALSKDHFS